MDWYIKVLKQYVDFSGRARRKEFWMFALFNILFTIAAIILEIVLGISPHDQPFGLISTLYGVAVFIPGLAVAVRRLHDVGKSGWWYLIVFIPIAGAITLLIWFCTDSQEGENQWGDNPKD